MATDNPFFIAGCEVLLDHDLTEIELRVLLALYSFKSKDRPSVWPSRDAISERCGYAVGTITNATGRLVKKGYLRRLGQFRRGSVTFEILHPHKAKSHQFSVPKTVHPRCAEGSQSDHVKSHRSNAAKAHRSDALRSTDLVRQK